ncbi:hypothetical protein BC829DRAFT_375460 [Chytridium lagenaria]|nr:hypothetical protein BC829DRAFT_375460 [Chytridium lagenaria]
MFRKIALITLALCGVAMALPQTSPAALNPLIPATCKTIQRENCDFYYNCIEVAKPCGEKGYARNFGGNFCRKFQQNVQKFSTKGQVWIWDVMQCLQTFLVPYLDNNATCSKIKDDAFKSHAGCYLNGSVSVCDLNIFDWLTLVKTIGFPTLIEIRTIMSQVEVGSKCALGYIEDILRSLATRLSTERTDQSITFTTVSFTALLFSVWDKPIVYFVASPRFDSMFSMF